MSTLDERAAVIYAFLRTHPGKRYTLPELCAKLGLQPGAKTRAAIHRARGLATDDGLHFPPAVPANGMTYTVTELAEDALDPAMHMSRIEAGARARADIGYEFMRRQEKTLPKDLRPALKATLAIRDEIKRSQAAMLRIWEDHVVDMVKARREDRTD